MSGCLYVVGTPIGNLGDLSPRAQEVLASCDFVAAEDTRVTLKLLNHFELKKPLTSYYEHNKEFKGQGILNRILEGESCALVTDAGMPAISDPGEDLVRMAHEQGIPVVSVPGPTAFATALAVSGMPTGRFTFEGFLSVNKKDRKEHLDSLVHEQRTMVFYEAPHKLSTTLRDLYATFGDRDLTIVRELTKIHEEIIRTTLSTAVEAYPNNDLKGELVLIVAGEHIANRQYDLEEALALAKDYVSKGMSKNNAAKTAAQQTGLKKGDIYKLLQE